MADFALEPLALTFEGEQRVQYRGARPMFMSAGAGSFVSYAGNALTVVDGFGPSGNVGIYEDEVAALLGAAVRPGADAVDSAGASALGFAASFVRAVLPVVPLVGVWDDGSRFQRQRMNAHDGGGWMRR